MRKDLKNYNQRFKVFGRKKGRKLLKNSNTEILNQYLLNSSSSLKNKKVILDIGSGNGENALILSHMYPEDLIIASDIYQNGNINLCNDLQNQGITNVKIFNQNVLLLFENYNLNKILQEVWILFPDPWPKKKHHKRRLINFDFLKKINFLLKKNGKIFIVTDSISYFINILRVFYDFKHFKWINDLPDEWDYKLNICHKTKYFEKATRNSKKSFILIFQRI